jgi:hypothetical protein
MELSRDELIRRTGMEEVAAELIMRVIKSEFDEEEGMAP